MAQALEDMEQVDAAIAHYRDFLAQNSQSITARSARQRLATLHMETDNHQAAIELYKEQIAETDTGAPIDLFHRLSPPKSRG